MLKILISSIYYQPYYSHPLIEYPPIVDTLQTKRYNCFLYRNYFRITKESSYLNSEWKQKFVLWVIPFISMNSEQSMDTIQIELLPLYKLYEFRRDVVGYWWLGTIVPKLQCWVSDKLFLWDRNIGFVLFVRYCLLSYHNPNWEFAGIDTI
jgi:hypothetical protein